jgi:ATP-binding cassette subfamily F protein uup
MGDQTLFSKLDFILSPGTRLGLIGANGSGKTTLLRLITGQLEPDAGEIKWADNLRIVQFDQSREQLNLDQPLKLALAPSGGDNVIYRDSPMHVAAWAKRFLFRTEQLEQSIRYMSGGEQARILIARLMLQPADLLVLDEPTNDLDIPTLEVLEESLAEFPGALVLVTHDRFMLDRLSTDLLALDPKRGWRTFADYAQWEKAGWFGKREAEVRGKPAAAPVIERPRLTRDEQKELSRMESKIEEAEGKLEALKARMASPEVSTDHEKLQETWAQVGEAEAKVAELYARWEELEAKRTAAAAG